MRDTEAPKITRSTRWFFGSGGLAQGVVGNAHYFVLIYYSQVLGLSPHLAGLALDDGGHHLGGDILQQVCEVAWNPAHRDDAVVNRIPNRNGSWQCRPRHHIRPRAGLRTAGPGHLAWERVRNQPLPH